MQSSILDLQNKTLLDDTAVTIGSLAPDAKAIIFVNVASK